MAFQYIDDILDCTATSKKIGKTVKKDESSGKVTAVALLGLKGAREKAERYKIEAQESLEKLGQKESKLSKISDFVIKRTF